MTDGSFNAEVARRRLEASAEIGRHIGNSHELAIMVLGGYAYHHAEVPQAVRACLERAYRNGALRGLCATSTLSQGMNLPTKTVLVPDTWRGQNDRVSVRDFWNTAGRAGRAGQETEGHVVFRRDRFGACQPDRCSGQAEPRVGLIGEKGAEPEGPGQAEAGGIEAGHHITCPTPAIDGLSGVADHYQLGMGPLSCEYLLHHRVGVLCLVNEKEVTIDSRVGERPHFQIVVVLETDNTVLGILQIPPRLPQQRARRSRQVQRDGPALPNPGGSAHAGNPRCDRRSDRSVSLCATRRGTTSSG